MQQSYHIGWKRRSRAVARVLALFGVVVLLWAQKSEAEPSALLVIVHHVNSESTLSASDLRAIYLTKKRKWRDGAMIEPVNLPEKTPHRRDFDSAVLGFDPDTAARYWIDRKVRGDARPPKRVLSPAIVQAHVASSQGGIGYVPQTTLVAGVKVVARIVDGRVLEP